jgi:hypothetical protein
MVKHRLSRYKVLHSIYSIKTTTENCKGTRSSNNDKGINSSNDIKIINIHTKY